MQVAGLAHHFIDLGDVLLLEAREPSRSWGSGWHGPGNNVFAYCVAPFGVVIEYDHGPTYSLAAAGRREPAS